jgi:hypothetical protein
MAQDLPDPEILEEVAGVGFGAGGGGMICHGCTLSRNYLAAHHSVGGRGCKRRGDAGDRGANVGPRRRTDRAIRETAPAALCPVGVLPPVGDLAAPSRLARRRATAVARAVGSCLRGEDLTARSRHRRPSFVSGV